MASVLVVTIEPARVIPEARPIRCQGLIRDPWGFKTTVIPTNPTITGSQRSRGSLIPFQKKKMMGTQTGAVFLSSLASTRGICARAR